MPEYIEENPTPEHVPAQHKAPEAANALGQPTAQVTLH
jgi:hypothetical protein